MEGNSGVKRVVCFGECMIELARETNGAAKVGFGGDTLNTAIYLARSGIETRYMTALGADAWSNDLKAAWAKEGVDTSLCLQHPTRTAGLYAISTDPSGERSFIYWRDQSAAREFFECDGVEHAFASASQTDLLFLSGISLAIVTPSQRRQLILLARRVRARGGLVAFDPNYRPKLWSSIEEFRQAVLQLAPIVSIALPSFDDEVAVWGDVDPAATAARWQALGINEVVVKSGPQGALTSEGWFGALQITSPTDTTGAGDSFNAGYLAARLNGASIAIAAGQGAQLAAQVVQYRGAIIPKEAMPPREHPL